MLRPSGLGLLGVLLFFFAEPGHAESKEWTVGLVPAYAVVSIDDRNPSGGGFIAQLNLGVTESLSIYGAAGLSWHPVGETPRAAGGTLGGFAGLLGIVYTVDVLRLVPYFDLGVGVVGVRGTTGFGDADRVIDSTTAFGVAIGIGLDYLVGRHLTVGLATRYHGFVTDLTHVPVYLFVGPRIAVRFGG